MQSASLPNCAARSNDQVAGRSPRAAVSAESAGCRHPALWFHLGILLCAFHASAAVTQQGILEALNGGSADQLGFSIAIDGDTAVVGAPAEDSAATGVGAVGGDDNASSSGAAYVFVRNGATWSQQAYLKASNTGADDYFGWSVAISGDTIVVGAIGERSNAVGVNGNQANNSLLQAGAAYVFVRNGTTWTQQAYLKASNAGELDRFGESVGIDGNTIVVGAPGESSNATTINGNQTNDLLYGSGAAYVFTRTGSSWSQQAYLKASTTDVNDWFGIAVAISGNTVAVGAYFEDSTATGVGGDQNNNSATESGAVFVFTRNGSTWSQQAYVKASNPGMDDRFGYSVALDGNTMIVGAPREQSNATGVNGGQTDNTSDRAGAAYVFFRTGTAWAQQAYLKSDNGESFRSFGWSVDVSGERALIGSFSFNRAFLFERTGGSWESKGGFSADEIANTGLSFGYGVGISGGTLVGGAPSHHPSRGAKGAGFAFLVTPDLPEIVVIDADSSQTLTDGGSTVDFDLAFPGGGVTKMFGIRNQGTAPLTGLAVSKSGSAAADFIIDDSSLQTTLEPGLESSFSVTFNPTSTGPRNAMLHVASNDADENPFDISVVGFGGTTGAPDIRVEYPRGTSLTSGAGTISFGGVLLGAGRDRTVVIRDFGNTELNIGSISFTGPGADRFSIHVAPDSLVFGGGETFLVVRFIPSGTSAASATLTITSDDPDENPFTVALTGNGITPTQFAQQAYLKASNTGELDYFGAAIALSGDTLVVGAWGEDSDANGPTGNQGDNSADDAGAAYVFVRNGSTWSQQAYLKAAQSDFNDRFGQAVAIDGDTLVIGAPGEAGAATTVNGDASDNSADSAGAAYVFTRSGETWTQQSYLKASNAESGDSFGGSVAISGNSVLVGAIYESSNATGVNGDGGNNDAFSSGAVYVFTRNGVTWSQQAYLKASNSEDGDQFGRTVGLSGDTAVIGAPYESSSSTGVNGVPGDSPLYSSGAAYVFVRNGTIWTQQAHIKSSRPEFYQSFGWTVAISSNSLVIGAPGESSGSTEINGDQTDQSANIAGAAYVFTRAGSVWSQQAYLKAPNAEAGDEFGTSVAIAADTVAVGAIQEASMAMGANGDALDNSHYSAGAVYIFRRTADTWSQGAYLKASNTDEGDQFGSAVALSGNTIVVGAQTEASNATGVQGNQTNNNAPGSGAVYAFTTSTGALPPVMVTIQRQGNEVVLTWTKTTPAYLVETKTALGPGPWGPAAGTPLDNGNSTTLRLTIGGGPRFFRLRWP